MVRPLITSTANPQVRATLRLRDRRDREERGLTVVDGAREVRRAVEAGADVVELWIADEACLTPDCRAVVSAVDPARRVDASPAVLDRLSFGDRSEGVVAVVRTPSTSLERLDLPPDPLIVVLDGVEKPGNVGAVLRTADAVGAAALVLAESRTDAFNPNAIRASLGTAFTVPIGAGTTAEVRDWCRDRGLRIVAARVDAAAEYTAADLRGPLAIVLGSEAGGLGDAWRGPDVEAVGLPMVGIADSLNVSATAAVLLYEARRQRTLPRSESEEGWAAS